MSIGSKAKASSSLWTRVVCSVWSAMAGRGSAGPESGLSGPAMTKQQGSCQTDSKSDVHSQCQFKTMFHKETHKYTVQRMKSSQKRWFEGFYTSSITLVRFPPTVDLRDWRLSKSSSSSPWSGGIITLSVMAGGSSKMPPPSSLLKSLSTEKQIKVRTKTVWWNSRTFQALFFEFSRTTIRDLIYQTNFNLL